MPVLVTSDQAIKRDPNMVAAGVRAVVKVQRALKCDLGLATKVGQALFPPAEAELIADVVARDLPYYEPSISDAAVAGLSRFALASGLVQRSLPYERVVAMEFRHLWTA
jgi:hypothetical protein